MNDYEEDPPGRYEQTGVMAPEVMDVKWIWDYDYLWLRVEAEMRGAKLRRNANSKMWEIDTKGATAPFLNEKGIREVMALLRANCNIVTGSSHFTEDQILNRCLMMAHTLLKYLEINAIEYEIKPGNQEIVAVTFMNAFEANLRKSLGGRALMAALQGERSLETKQTLQQPPRSSGVLGFIGR